MRVSVVATVKNEEGSIGDLLDSLATQERPADEIVVVDGGSTDRTLDILREGQERLPLKLISREGANISQGRNEAIGQAMGDVIASTDGGVRADPRWLEHLVGALRDEEVDVASGFFVADSGSAFQTALAATTYPDLSDVDPERFLPSSRSVAFRRRSWSEVGGYPEWLDYSEDLVFDLRLQGAGFRFKFVPDAVVRFAPRPSISAFVRQYYLYARGDGKADLWRSRHAARYASYLVLGPALLVLGGAITPWFWALLFMLALAHLWAPFRRLVPRMSELGPIQRVVAIFWVPVIRLAGDVAKMLGYPVGVWWRWRHRPVGSHGP